MRRLVLGLGLLALSACAQQPPVRSFALFFNDFSSSLDSTAAEIVATAATVAKGYPLAPVRVSGYADSAGSAQRDIDLSKARADAVASLLSQDGVDPKRIERTAVGTPPNSQPGVERRRVEIDIGVP